MFLLSDDDVLKSYEKQELPLMFQTHVHERQNGGLQHFTMLLQGYSYITGNVEVLLKS